MTDFTHSDMNKKFHTIEKVLIRLGYSGIDDYTTMIHPVNITVSDELQNLFLDLGQNVTTAEEYFRALKALLKQYGVPFHMVHKTKGNYLQLIPAQNDLDRYIMFKKANMFKDLQETSLSMEDLENFKYEKYIKDICCKSKHILRDDSQSYENSSALRLLAKDPEIAMVIKHNDSYRTQFTIYPLKRQVITTILRREDAICNLKVYLCNDDDEILQIIHNPNIDVGGTLHRADSTENAVYTICCPYNEIVAVIDVNDDVLMSPTLKVTIVYDGIYLNNKERHYLMRVNSIIPMYNMNITYPELGQQRISVHSDNYKARHSGNLYDFKVHGNHKLSVVIGGQMIQVQTMYCPDTDTTNIVDFTKESPFYSRLSYFHQFSIELCQNPPKRMTIDYCVDPSDYKLPERIKKHWDPIVSKDITCDVTISHENFKLRYLNGLVGTTN